MGLNVLLYCYSLISYIHYVQNWEIEQPSIGTDPFVFLLWKEPRVPPSPYEKDDLAQPSASSSSQQQDLCFSLPKKECLIRFLYYSEIECRMHVIIYITHIVLCILLIWRSWSKWPFLQQEHKGTSSQSQVHSSHMAKLAQVALSTTRTQRVQFLLIVVLFSILYILNRRYKIEAS